MLSSFWQFLREEINSHQFLAQEFHLLRCSIEFVLMGQELDWFLPAGFGLEVQVAYD